MYSSSVRGRRGASTTTSSSTGSGATGDGERLILSASRTWRLASPGEPLEGSPHDVLERGPCPPDALDRTLGFGSLVAQVHERGDRLAEDTVRGRGLSPRGRAGRQHRGAVAALDDDPLGELL